MGKPVVCRLGRKEPFDVFQDVMPDIANQTTVQSGTLISLASTDSNVQLKAILLVIIDSFIAPTNNCGKIGGKYVPFVKDLDDVKNFAWGAALLAYLVTGLQKLPPSRLCPDGNLWIIVAFFLIIIPKLRKIFKIKLGLGDEEESDNDENDGERDGVPQVPLLQSVVEKVKDISFNHKFDYKNEVELCFNNLTENDVVLKPYNRDWLPAELLAQLDFVTYLGPIFCLNDVVLRRPHFVAKQFGCLEAVDFGENFSNLCWADYTIVLKQNKGPWEIDLEGWYEDDLKRWRDGNCVLDCLPLRMWPTDLHQSNQTSSINDSPESSTPELSNALSFSVPSTRSFSTTSSSSRSPTPPTPSPILGKGMRRKKPIDRLTYSAPKKVTGRNRRCHSKGCC